MELKANELRLGNLVYLRDRNGYTREVIIEHLQKDKDMRHFEPIPLTEEWLIRLGFEKDKMFFEFSIHTIRINIVLFPISPKNEEYQVRINNSTTQIFIQYVHQLQNLYHALTCEELELSPK